MRCAVSPGGLRPVHIEGLSLKAHGPSSLCVDLVNYLGCQGPTTAYPRGGGGSGASRRSWGLGQRGCEKTRACRGGGGVIVEGWSEKNETLNVRIRESVA